VIILLAVYLPGLGSIPAVDRDESRFAQASRQMFESLALPEDEGDRRPIERLEDGRLTGGFHAGGAAVPMVQDRPRLNKPPLIYWLQTASAWVFTGGDPSKDAIWMARFPSVVSAVIACLATWRIGLLLLDARAAWLGAVLLGVCPMVVWDAHQARADQLLLACVTLAMFALTRLWLDDRPLPERPPLVRWGVPAGFWLALSAGILAKGPIAPMVLVLTALGASLTARRWRWLLGLKPIVGIVIMLACLTPWVVLVARTVGWDTLTSILFDETVGRSAGAKEGHWGPPGYHLVLLAVLLWPGSMLTLAAFVRAWRLAVRIPPHEGEKTGRLAKLRSLPGRWRRRIIGRPGELWPLAWVVPSWVVFELVGTKLPHYTMPLYPALALLSASAVVDAARGAMDSASLGRLRLGLKVWAWIGGVLAVGAPIGLALLGGGWLALGVAGIVAGVAVWQLKRAIEDFDDEFVLRVQLRGVLVAAGIAAGLLGVIMPRANGIWVTRSLARAIESADPDETRSVANAGYHEDSLIYATRGRAERIGVGKIDAWAASHPGGILVVPRGEESELVARGWTVLEGVSGINYSSGGVVNLVVLERGR